MGIFQQIKDFFAGKAKAAETKMKEANSMDPNVVQVKIDRAKDKIKEISKKISDLHGKNKYNEMILGQKKEKFQNLAKLAEKAVKAGNMEDAKQILESKKALENEMTLLESSIKNNKKLIDQSNDTLNEMQRQVTGAENDKEGLTLEMEAAKARESLAVAQSEVRSDDSALASLKEFRMTVDKVKAHSDAVVEEVANENGNIAESMEKKYSGNDEAIDAELAALQAKVSQS